MSAPVTGHSDGIYIPPFKLARMKQEEEDAFSAVAQRLEWEHLRKCIKGLINKVAVANIKDIVQELFVLNVIRGRGLFVRSILQAQISLPIYTHVYAALVAVVNSKIPGVGELLLNRMIMQFRRAYMRNDEMLLTSLVRMFAHLLNQRVITDVVVLQIAMVFLEKLSNDSVKLCCVMLRECGQVLNDASPKGVYFIFERLRMVLQEGLVDKRTQYIVEGLFESRKRKFQDHPGVLAELDLIEESDQVTHEIDVLEGEVDGQESLNIFRAEPPQDYEKNENEWKETSNEILGFAAEEVGQVPEEEEKYIEPPTTAFTDMTEQDLVNLRRTIYLAIMSSANFEECVHKLLRLNLRRGQEKEVVNMLIDSCCSEKTSNRFYALQAERLCRLSRGYRLFFEEALREKYDAMHRFETGKIRNMAKFFSHLLHTDSLDWSVLECVRLTEEDTNSSTRIFIKILFQDLHENMGTDGLVARFSNEKFAQAFSGILPSDNAENIRFSINLFTAIGLGELTPILRQRLNEISLRIAMQEASKQEALRAEEEVKSEDGHARDRSRHRGRDHHYRRDDDDAPRKHQRRRSRSYSRL